MTVDAPPDVTVDAPGPGMDAKPDVGGGVDATMDAPPETSPPIDAPADIASPPDASEASPPPSEGGLADDGGLGSCVTAGTFSGVECNGSTCVTGDVCCIDHDPIGMTLFETCTPPSGCTAGINSFGHQISSYACRNRGDCATGNVCCAGTAPSAGLVLSCVAAGSCAGAFTQTLACRNTCECTTGTCKGVVGGCYGESVATCSGTCP